MIIVMRMMGIGRIGCHERIDAYVELASPDRVDRTGLEVEIRLHFDFFFTKKNPPKKRENEKMSQESSTESSARSGSQDHGRAIASRQASSRVSTPLDHLLQASCLPIGRPGEPPTVALSLGVQGPTVILQPWPSLDWALGSTRVIAPDRRGPRGARTSTRDLVLLS